jgi:hypothetical protein
VVIGAPDIYYGLKAPLEFIAVVGQIGGKIGAYSVCPHYDAVFFIAKGGAFKPERPLVFVDKAALTKVVDGFSNQIFLVELPFAKPVVEANAEYLKVIFYALEDAL